MKKRQQKNQGLTIDFLQRKYQQEKQILSKQNKRLTEQLNIEIERYNELESKMDKNSRVKNEKLEELQRENQILQAKILEMERQEESVSELEVETLTEHKQLFTENQRLINEMEELQNTLLNMNNELSTLEQKLQLKQEEQKEITQNFKLLAEKHEKFKKESQNQIDRLVQENALLVEQRQKIAGKVADQKRRKKDLQKKIGELQKIVNNIKQEQNRLEQEIEDIKTEKEKQSQKNIELNMKLSLYQPKITNLENFIAKLEQEAKQQQKKIANQREINEQLRIKLEKTSKEIRHYQSEITLLRQQCNKLETQLQKSNLSKEEWIKAIRQNETEELIGLIKGGYSQCSQKQLKKGTESMHNRQSGSQNQLQLFNRIQQNQDKTLERMKLQNQINSLQVQIGQYRKQLQNLNYQLNKSKRIVEDKSLDIERKESQIRQWRIRAERLQSDRNKELATLRNQNQLLKSRDTQRLQKAKQFDEYETAMSLKLAFYERKIKEHLDTIDRKQTIIQKLQMHRNQFEDKQKNYDQNMQKLSEEVDFLRRFKQDCNRKDQLLKDYKAKLQKSKQELQQLKNEVFQLKKDKHRLQKQVQSKEQYINSLKARQQKQQPEKIEDNTKDNKLKELKMNYQGKIRNLKKEKDDMSTGLREVRITVMNKVEEIVARHIPVAKKKTQEYEAAKLLGIKPGELDEFLNPGSAMNRKIAQQLQQLWLQQSYSQFIIRFTSYIQKHNSSTELKKQL